MNEPVRIAMWSGPRNLSTAMMYSFAQHSGCEVIDEPFYPAYLHDTGLDHPYAKEIIANGPISAEAVCEALSTGIVNSPVQYQKHITKHLLADYPRDWLALVCNIFLIRHPARVICSYHIKDEDPEISDIGILDQWQIYQRVIELGQTPIVVDSYDILRNPERELRRICAFAGIEFQTSMLSWPAGPKQYDGIWAPHWYHSVWQSEGFAQPPGELPQVPEHLNALLQESMPYYERLKALTVTD